LTNNESNDYITNTVNFAAIFMGKNALCFTANSGVAKGWTIFWTEKCLFNHQRNYGNLRPYLDESDFVEKKVKEAIENSSIVKQDVKIDDKTKKKILKNDIIVFYKELLNNKYQYDGKPDSGIMEYLRVVCSRDSVKKTLCITTAHITPRINKKDISPDVTILN
jgi:hypothetical protein